jgi:3-oxoacyl-(acyl-carrier-protein) synthase
MVFSHAMGDCQVDAAEQQALEACGIDAPNVAVSASLGHTGAASGMICMATAAIAVAEGQIPPTRHQMRPESTRLLADVRKPDSPIALCLCHTTNGNATAVILGR